MKICNNWYKTLSSSCNFINSSYFKITSTIKIWFLRAINWNKYQSDPKTYAQNQYLNHVVDPSLFVDRLFVLSFENENGRTSHSEYYIPKVETKVYSIKIDGKNFFDQPIDYLYFQENHKIIAIDFSKQQALDADPGAIQLINFTANLDRAGNSAMFFIIEEAKETVLDFSEGTVKVLWICYRII